MHPLLDRARWPWRAMLVLGLLAAPGCGSDVADPAGPATGVAGEGLYWALTLDHEAVTLSTAAPYDTLVLTAVPRDARGVPLAGLGPVTFTSAEPDRVQVTADGVIRALAPATNVDVIAALSHGNARHADTLSINVTDTPAPPVLASVALDPIGADSAKWAVKGDASTLFALGPRGTVLVTLGKSRFVRAVLTDADGATMSNVAVTYASRDTTIATVNRLTALLEPKRPGRAMITATATAYGVQLADTLEYAITMPVFGVARITTRVSDLGGGTVPVFEPGDVTIAPGGTVLWANITGEPVDVTFDDPATATLHGKPSCFGGDVGGTGGIEAFGELQDPAAAFLSAANCRSRQFLVPGIYPYHSTTTGATGRVIVADGLGAP